jgi:lysylphosphatidylglycerol synthetase-like protein (DUF2156 family)
MRSQQTPSLASSVPPAAGAVLLLLLGSTITGCVNAHTDVQTSTPHFLALFLFASIVVTCLLGLGWTLLRRLRSLSWALCVLLLAAAPAAHADAPTKLPAIAGPIAPQLVVPAQDPVQVPAPSPTLSQQAAANAVPPACPEPCAACGARLGSAATDAGLPTWGKALIGLGVILGVVSTGLDKAHEAGLF